MPEILATFFTLIYFAAACMLFIYGLNCYVMLFVLKLNQKTADIKRLDVWTQYNNPMDRSDLPVVTTQIPLYNEYNVANRIIRAVCEMQYPEGKHEIQVLDDSNDETQALVDAIVNRQKKEGHDISVIRRDSRIGYKAGALKNGTDQARGELTAVFDADFVPQPDFFLKCVPFFMDNPRLGLAQARWGHLNHRTSLLTRAQSIGIDGHFMVEQAARNWGGLFMNFNGTAGLWRRSAIEAAGGWQWDTLTEDMDLSYRIQLADWETVYIPEVVAPAEIPQDVSAFKSQQFRWAKGSIQTAKKLLPSVWASDASLFKKIQAVFHMTHYLVHPLMLFLSLMALPVLLTLDMVLNKYMYVGIGVLLILAMIAPNVLYIFSQKMAYKDWKRRILCLPALVVIGVGLAISNTHAVFEAVIGKVSGFVRTPKKGDTEIKHYKVKLPWKGILEILLGSYCAVSLNYYILEAKYLVGPFLAIYASGFLFIGLLSVAHRLGLDGFDFTILKTEKTHGSN